MGGAEPKGINKSYIGLFGAFYTSLPGRHRGPLGHLRCRHGYEHGNPGDIILCSPEGSIPDFHDSRVHWQCNSFEDVSKTILFPYLSTCQPPHGEPWLS